MIRQKQAEAARQEADGKRIPAAAGLGEPDHLIEGSQPLKPTVEPFSVRFLSRNAGDGHNIHENALVRIRIVFFRRLDEGRIPVADLDPEAVVVPVGPGCQHIEMGRKFLPQQCDQPVKMLDGDGDVDIVIPGNEAGVADGANRRATDGIVRDSVIPAYGGYRLVDIQNGLL